MPTCTKAKRSNRTVCASALNKRIELLDRSIQATQFGTKKFDEEFKEQDLVWAKLDTKRGKQTFDGTNLTTAFTHEFTIRYREDVADNGQQFWIKFEDRLFDIIDDEDLDENHEWIVFKIEGIL